MIQIPKPGDVFYDDDGNKSTVLPDGSDLNYNPPQDELEEYAEFVGIDVEKEKELMWVALEGLRTPLPPEWRACQTNDDEVYYFNFKTGASLWDHPMDNIFKEKVIAERAKLKSGGGSQPPGASESPSTSTAGLQHSKASAKGETKPSPESSKNNTESKTKMLTASLLGSKKGQPAGTLNVVPKTGRLSSLGNPGLESTPLRRNPDVSDILHNSSFGGAQLSGSHSDLFKSGSTSLHAGPQKSVSCNPPQGTMDIEKNIRHRINAEYEGVLKNEMREKERNYIAEKSRLEKSLTHSQENFDSSWAAEKEEALKRMNAATARETKEMEQSWQRRIKELRQTVENRETELQQAKVMCGEKPESDCTVEEYTKVLEHQNEVKLEEKKKELQAKMDAALKNLEDEQKVSLEELSKRANDFVQSTRKRIDSENAQALFHIHSSSQGELTQLMTQLSQLREELKKAQQEASKSKPQQKSLASIRAEKNSTPSVEVEAVKRAQKEADAEVKEVDAALDKEMEELEESYMDQQRELNSELEELQKEIEGLKKATLELSTLPSSQKESSPAPADEPVGLSQRDLEDLAEEETAMRLERSRQIERFEKETEELCRTKKEFLEKESPRTPGSAAPASGSSSTAATHPAVEKAKQNHLQLMKQLEFTHEQTMRNLRDAHRRALESQDRFDVRTSSEYKKLLNEKKKAWLAVHPTPNYNVDELPNEEDLEEEELEALGPIRSEEVQAEANCREQKASCSVSSAFPADVTLDKEREAMQKRLRAYREQWQLDVGARIKESEEELQEEFKRLALENRKEEENQKTQSRLKEEHLQRMEKLRERLLQAQKNTEILRSTPPVTKPKSYSEAESEPETDPEDVDSAPSGALVGNTDHFIPFADAQNEVQLLKQRWEAELANLHRGLMSQQDQLTKILLVRQRPPVVPSRNEKVQTSQIMSSGSLSEVEGRPKEYADFSAGRKAGSRGVTPSIEVAAAPLGHRCETEERTPFHSNTAPPLLSRSFLSSPDVVPPAAPHPDEAILSRGDRYSAYVEQEKGYQAGIEAARLRLKEQKKVLRDKQRALERMREEWREDMALAKQEEDKPAVHTLRQVRHRMEERARRLNVAVLAMKLESEQLEELQRFGAPHPATPEADFSFPMSQNSILRLVKEMTAQSRQLEGLLRGGEARPSVERRRRGNRLKTSPKNDKKSKPRESSYSPRSHSRRPSADHPTTPPLRLGEWDGAATPEEIRWQKVNYQRQVENWLQHVKRFSAR